MTDMEGESIGEDEDVIIEGSDLHEALMKMGYTEFESATVARTELAEPLDNFKMKVPSTSKSSIYNRLISIYQHLMQDDHSSRKQLQTILQTKPLLDDHGSVIQRLISENNNNTVWRKIFTTLPVVSSTITIATGILIAKQKTKLALIVALPALVIAAHSKYIRWSAEKDLKRLVSLENDLYYLSKRVLKILRHGYRMKVDLKHSEPKFTDFGAERLKYLQPLTEIFISTLEHQSRANYRASLIIAKCLPSSFNSKEFITNFEGSTLVTGEITYSALKRLYYTYILIQSEMLQLLAIAYNSNTWSGYSRIPETKLSLIIKRLVESLTKYSGKLRKVVDDYCSCQLKFIRHEYKGSTGSKWQDLYVHLDLTSHKIQTVYNQIVSILQDIDVYEETEGSESSFTESLKEKMNEVHKKIDTAKSFAETSSLLIARMQNVNQEKLTCDEESLLIPIMTPDVVVVRDSAPQIMDEVFEEYIKEEYLKSLYEDGDDVLQEKYKLDKSLAKNFMGELKEVLIEKQKSMTERELKALQRMYKNVEDKSAVDNEEKEVNSKDSEIPRNPELVPEPPPLPVTIKNDGWIPVEEGRKYRKPVPLPRKRQDVPPSKLNNWADDPQSSGTHSEPLENVSSSRNILVPPIPPPLPPLPLVVNNEDVEKCPLAIPALSTQLHSFFNVTEETFVGSGENSEEELVDSELDNNNCL